MVMKPAKYQATSQNRPRFHCQIPRTKRKAPAARPIPKMLCLQKNTIPHANPAKYARQVRRLSRSCATMKIRIRNWKGKAYSSVRFPPGAKLEKFANRAARARIAGQKPVDPANKKNPKITVAESETTSSAQTPHADPPESHKPRALTRKMKGGLSSYRSAYSLCPRNICWLI